VPNRRFRVILTSVWPGL